MCVCKNAQVFLIIVHTRAPRSRRPHCKRKATSQPSGPHHRKALDPCVERKAASVKLVKWFRNTVAKKSTRAVCARFVSSDGPESLEHTIENKTECAPPLTPRPVLSTLGPDA